MFKRTVLAALLLFTLVLTGCSEEEEQTVEDFFDQEMERMHDQEEISYELIYSEEAIINENDAIGIFVEQYEHGEQFFMVYLEQQDDQWEWKNTRFLDMNTYTKWSDLNQTPYLYAGAVNNAAVSEVYVGDTKANFITSAENNRFWYALNEQRFAEVFYKSEDGARERVEPVDFH